MTLHREGRYIVPLLFFILDTLGFLAYRYLEMPWWILIWVAFLILFLFVLNFFRNPKIDINKGAQLVLAPADGKVVVVEPTEETEYLKDRRIQISIFMSPLNVHVNRTPVAGSITYFKYHPGKYMVAWHPKSSTENERTTMVLKMSNGLEILVRQIAGAVARRIKWYVDKDRIMEQGDEFGFIKFGSRVDVFLPLDAEIKVKPGDISKGGRTVLAELSSE